ncbi:MAG: excinuclease ABC subunit UvrC [Bacteroidales bacterium]|nr:excinuclease ABC subunit UvrC [Bacteroidales bacterium]
MNDFLKDIISSLPNNPGVYQFFDKNDKIIYIGKAKNLKKRVQSHFLVQKNDNAKKIFMLNRIANIKFVIVDTEFDALLLENSLIKKWQPRYNVLLKDDKTFPWICIKNENFPRVFHTRNVYKDGSEYYGPYAFVKTMYVLLDLIRQLFKLRNCNLVLSEENIKKNKFKTCLEFHIGNCKAPCVGLESQDEYNSTIKQIRQLIKGHISAVIQEMKILMKSYADNFVYEKAQILKEKISLLVNYQSKSTVVSTKLNNVDVFSICSNNESAFVNFFKVANGSVIQSHTVELKKKLDESDQELLGYAILDIRLRLNSNSKEIVVPFKPDMSLPDVKYTIPQIGDKKQLLELSFRNVKYFMMESKSKKFLKNPESPGERLMKVLQKDLNLNNLPAHIECFDISNMQGTDAVGSISVFKDAKPSKKDYRIFNIKTVEGPNDYASLEEVIHRRYKRILDENSSLPQLIIIDGGKGQLGAAVKSLSKLNLIGKIAVIGIAKKLEEIFFPGDSIPLYLDKRSESLRIIQHLRNEAHRFGIKHHRNKSEKRIVNSEIFNVKGIGQKTAEALFHKFKSVKSIKEASLQDLQNCIGVAKGQSVFNYFLKNK